MVVQTTDTTLSDFSGGLTGDTRKALSNQCYELNNMIITPHKGVRTRYGSKPIYQTNTFQRCRGIYSLNDLIYFFIGTNLQKLNNDSSSTLVPTINAVQLFDIGDANVTVQGKRWRNHLLLTGSDQRRPASMFRDTGGVDRIISLGLPNFTTSQESAINITHTGASGSNSYLFSFIWTLEYTVGDVKYRKVSRPYTIQKSDFPDLKTAETVSFSGLPVLSNGAFDDGHYNTADTKLEIYVSANNGSVPFLLTTITNGTVASGPHHVDDAVIVTKLGLYTNGGLSAHDAPPICKAIELVGDTAYYMNIAEELQDGTIENRPYRIVQSIPGIATSVNKDFFLDLDDDIVGGGIARGNLIVFTDTFIYRIDGQISATGAGSLRPTPISQNIGCVSRDSIVTTKDGIYFAGRDGFYFTDGFNFKELTSGEKSLEKAYRKLVASQTISSRINGVHDAMNDLVVWSVSLSNNATENDGWWMYDVKFDAFSTASGNTFGSASLLYDDETIYRGDEFGYIFEHKETYDCDYVRTNLDVISAWKKAYIPWKLKPAFFTNLNDRLWARSVNIVAESNRDVYVNVGAELINGRKFSMVPIIYKASSIWRDDGNFWRDETNLWKPSLIQARRRRFPSGSSRSRGITVSLEAGEGPVYISDVFGKSTLSYVSPTDPTNVAVELTDPDAKWPEDCVGYSITFGPDYQVRYTIKSRSDSTLTIVGGSGLAVGTPSLYDWEVVGIPKNQNVEIKSISYNYGQIGKEDNKFQKGQDGGNAE